MLPRIVVPLLAMAALAGCLGSNGAPDADLEAWLDDGCGEVLLWARDRPALPEAPPTVGGLAPGPVVAYAEELAAGADGLTLRLQALGPPGNDAADELYDDLLAELAEVSSGATAVADEYRSEPAIPLTELAPLLREATDLSVGVATAFRAFSRDPDVGPIVVEIDSCEAVSAIIG
jgi:hypothetical protein